MFADDYLPDLGCASMLISRRIEGAEMLGQVGNALARFDRLAEQLESSALGAEQRASLERTLAQLSREISLAAVPADCRPANLRFERLLEP